MKQAPLPVEELLQRFRNNECTPEEIELLQQWLIRLNISDASTDLSPEQLNAVKNRMYQQLISERTVIPDRHRLPEDLRNPRQVAWYLMPIVYKIADANGKGDYATGLAPDHQVVETGKLPLSPAGEPGDWPVDKALTLIYGTTAVTVTSL
jgi:hypothetical protein